MQKYVLPFSMDFDLATGLCSSGKVQPSRRYASDLAKMYADHAAAVRLAERDNPLMYEFFELESISEDPSELRFGTSIVYPGKVGDEYFMTKGHFHTVLDTAEVYYCLSGEGAMLMETPEGDVRLLPMKPGEAVYVGARYAHRSINTGGVPMVSFFVFRADAGHDYGTIEQKGFRKLLVERDGKPALVDNPQWTD